MINGQKYFKIIPNKYRPIPFWSWNEKLETDETMRQIGLMKNAGMGGFIMHARGGLQTEYMGDDWFENVRSSIESAEKNDMCAWAYDENGWPSGFGNGRINGIGEEYQQKILRMEKGEKDTPHTICNIDGFHFYYEVNPFYTDLLSEKVVKKFIDEIYAPYYDRFGDRLKGFFTDEPQLTENGIPWSQTLPDSYEKEYGESLLKRLPELFMPTGEYYDTRKKFYRLITKLFSENYAGQIYNWCNKRGIKLTGHLVSEGDMRYQTPSGGSCMASYEFFHIPGMDWLGRNIREPLPQLQLVSAALQTGKKQILSESFALCGHNVSFSELRRIYEWQMVRGVNLLCQHLQGYSLRGIRKRDYPPAMYYQQPWWDEYKLFIDAMSRIGMLIAEGEPECDVLLMHPMTTAWICYDGDKCDGLNKYQSEFINVIETLEKKHVQFHLGDETIIERHGRVSGNRFIIGRMEYTTVMLPPHIDFLDNTKRLIDEFKKNGGKIITVDEVDENGVTNNANITYLKRIHKDFDMHYFVNSTNEFQKAKINVDGKKLNILTGDNESFNKEYCFSPYDSLVVIDDRNTKSEYTYKKVNLPLALDGKWIVTECTENALLLDVCDCYFDDELVGKKMSVSEIQDRACALKRPVKISCIFYADIESISDNICLVSETPEIFEYIINGTKIDFNDEGYFRDISFRKTDITQYLKIGKNIIEMNCTFKQSKKTYTDFENAEKYASVRNSLTYDMEIENIYITGNFSVKTAGKWKTLDKCATRYNGEFKIDKPITTVELKDIQKQGFLFFAGRLVVKKIFDICDINKYLQIKIKGINVVKIKINDQLVSTVIWNNDVIDLSSYLKKGENIIEMVLFNNLRNLLGPHHLEEGESYMVRPSSFIKGENIWNWNRDKPIDWNDGYCFTEQSVE